MANRDDDFTQNPTDDVYQDPDTDASMKTSPDEQPPFAPPTNTSRKKIDDTDPRTDYKSDIDRQELYDEGLTSATGSDTSEESDHEIEKPVERY
jgi:hypothetical protein